MSPRAADGRLLEVYWRLYEAYGPQRWWPGDGPFEVIVGAILTQSAAWTNVEKALANLKAAGRLSPGALMDIAERALAPLVRPSCYFNEKARKLKAFACLLRDSFGGDLDRLLATPPEELRPLLLSCHGIGPETADSILLYAAGQPSFVIDSYTRRLFARLGFRPSPDTYEGWRRLFMQSLPQEAPLFNEYHALIVRHGKERCRKQPLCEGCPLLDACPAGGRSAGTRNKEPGATPCCLGKRGRSVCNKAPACASYVMVPNPPFWARHRKAPAGFPVML
jgi:endonuclease-3 related protein